MGYIINPSRFILTTRNLATKYNWQSYNIINSLSSIEVSRQSRTIYCLQSQYSTQKDLFFIANDKSYSKNKTAKMITIKDKIEQHDLMSKLSHIRKWLLKGHSVKAIIQNLSQDAKNVENLYNNLTKELAEVGKFETRKTTNRETRFVIEPKCQNESDILKESK